MSDNNNKLHASSSIAEFLILKAFKVFMKHPNAPSIEEFIWKPPVFNWIKCNIDGASIGNPGPLDCGGVFRDKNADFLGSFAYNIGLSSSLIVELNGAMYAVEIAHQKGWRNLWVKTDSMLVALVFKSHKIVPCQLQNRWHNCLHFLSAMSFFITHIYREGNHCADIGLSIPFEAWWHQLSIEIRGDFSRNRLGLPFFTFCWSFEGFGFISPLLFVLSLVSSIYF